MHFLNILLPKHKQHKLLIGTTTLIFFNFSTDVPMFNK